jgi:ribonucleoside-diphosphate reductase alpha chain
MRPAPPAITGHIWDTRYRYRHTAQAADATIEDTWRRIAEALAQAEHTQRDQWQERFRDVLADFVFLPGGRIQAGAGTDRTVTLFNCFVMDTIEGSTEGIFRALREGALTMQQGGGVGYDFSTAAPRGTRPSPADAVACGPVALLDLWDAMSQAMLASGERRGAMMGTLRCDHPDIEAFISAKLRPGRLTHFNLSVLVSDAFIAAVRQDQDWPLTYPAGGAAVRHVRARDLWRQLIRASYERGEPGVLFVDRINHWNNLWYCERISATNPCGEIPLPPYGACDLGSINLARLIEHPFTPRACLDQDRLVHVAATAVRMLDDVIDVSRFPLPQQRDRALASRRIGLGVTGLADALILLGLRYGSAESLAWAAGTMRTICHTAYRTSIALAGEKGVFPAFDRDRYLAAPFILALPADIRDAIARHGIRNSHLTAIAPTGTISLLAGNVSSGIEPVFAARYRRTVRGADDRLEQIGLTDNAVRLWQEQPGHADDLPPALVSATELPVAVHLDMQAALQPYVDNSISKTINVPADYAFDAFEGIFLSAYDRGLKGCTVFRPTEATGAVLTDAATEIAEPRWCAADCRID